MKKQHSEGHMHEHHGHKSGSHMYKNEVDEPHVPAHGHQEHGLGCADFKKEAQDIAYGQAGVQGIKSDSKKMAAQFKNYHWDSDTGGASGY